MIIIYKPGNGITTSYCGKRTNWFIEFEGTLKECKSKMVEIYNDLLGECLGFASDVREAVKFSKNSHNGLDIEGRHLAYNGQFYAIITKKYFKKYFLTRD